MNHARQADCEIEIACRSDGTILGMRGEVFVDLGAYVRTNGLIQPRTLAQCLTGPYRVPNVRMTSTALLTNKTPSGTYRAPGRYEGVVLLRAADRAGGARPRDRQRRDAAPQPDRRRRNAVPAAAAGAGRSRRSIPNATAATIARRSTAASPSSAGRKSARCRAARSTAAITASPSPALSREAAPGRRRRRGSNWKRTARCRCMSARPAVGQGLETVMAQIAADTLGLPLGQVRVFHGSTPFLDEGYGAFASRSTVLGGSAVFEAAKALLDKIRAAAAARLGVAAEQIELADGRARAQRRTLACLRRAGERTGCGSTPAFANDNRLTYTYGSAAAHVAVDPGTGRCRAARLSRRRGCRPHRQSR